MANILEQIEPINEEQYDVDPGVYSSLHVDLNEVDWTDCHMENPDPTLILEQLQDKSQRRYEQAYRGFMEWFKESGFLAINEDTLLTYFEKKSEIFKSSTLWSLYSMIKATLILRDNINIGKLPRLLALLKNKKKECVTNKSRVFTKQEVQKFLKEAPDETYLMMKVVLIIGISGGCCRDELAQLTIDDVQDLGAALLIKIPDPKSKLQRSFTIIPEQADELNCLEIYRKYRKLRPAKSVHRRFFLTYKAGACTNQVVGVNSFGRIPSQIARYLQLPEPESFTGHCFRKSSVLLSNSRKGVVI